MKKRKLKNRLFLMSVISLFTYYSASIDKTQVTESMGIALSFKGINILLALIGIALIVAWLPDIINSLVIGRYLGLIEVYTTQITYVLDIGVIAPTTWICLFQLKK
ncbi:hypothetical protein [Clostridium estertheticum]|uniref:hypothetical protein n=1 Tax=Clostridium estertheticum TaxID=238834 RepID=UPI0021624B54|nr:hypothetical protein [Clostridium estertheticum]